MENVTRGMIRSGWKGYSDSFDPWMGQYASSSFRPKKNNNNNNNNNTNNSSVNPTYSYGGGVGNQTNPRGVGVKDRGNRVPYVNPNPSKNERGSAFK